MTSTLDMLRHSRTAAYLLGGILLLAALFLLPILKTAYLGDDNFTSYIDGWMGANHAGVFDAVRFLNDGTIAEKGRWFPVTAWTEVLLFHFTHHPWEVKLLQWLGILINLLTFFVFAFKLSRSKGFALLAATLVILTFQLRYFHDGILQFSLLLPTITELILLSFIFLIRYTEEFKPADLALSAAAFFVGCMTYEIIYPFVIALGFLAFRLVPQRRRALMITALYVGILALFSLISFVLRSHAQLNATSPYIVSHDVGAYVATLFNQLFAALPFSYLVVNPNHFFPALPEIWMNQTALGLLTVLTAAGVAYFLIVQLGRSRTIFQAVGREQTILILAALLWLLPAILVPLSPRYEHEIRFGLGYITVYIEGLGVALLAACAVFSVTRGFKSDAPLQLAQTAIAGAVVFAILVGSQFGANAFTIRQYAGWTLPRQNLDAALDAGVMASVPKDAVVFLDKSHPVNFVFVKSTNWYSGYYYFAHTHRLYTVEPIETESTTNPVCSTDKKNACEVKNRQVWELRSAAPTPGVGYVIVSKLDAIEPSKDPADPAALTRDAMIFERGPEMSPYPPKAPVRVAQDMPSDQFHILTHGPGWALYAFHARCTPVLSKSLVTGTALDLAFDKNVYGEEHDGSQAWRWARKNASITIGNPTDSLQRATLSFGVQTYSARTSTVTVRSSQFRKVLPLRSAEVPVQETIILKPHATLKIDLSSTAPAVTPQSGDQRDMHFKIDNLKLTLENACKK